MFGQQRSGTNHCIPIFQGRDSRAAMRSAQETVQCRVSEANPGRLVDPHSREL
ncbi:hypothetical protein LINPERPRIM_LOCUS13260 [Linum perenne]